MLNKVGFSSFSFVQHHESIPPHPLPTPGRLYPSPALANKISGSHYETTAAGNFQNEVNSVTQDTITSDTTLSRTGNVLRNNWADSQLDPVGERALGVRPAGGTKQFQET